MTLNTIARAANDPELQSRIVASVYSEALNNPALVDTAFAQQVRAGFLNLVPMYWAVAEGVQAAYEAGVTAGRGSPGYDPDVVTDGAITSAVVANWPPDQPPPVTP